MLCHDFSIVSVFVRIGIEKLKRGLESRFVHSVLVVSVWQLWLCSPKSVSWSRRRWLRHLGRMRLPG